ERVQTGDGVVGAGDVHDLAAGIRAAIESRPRPGVLNLSIATNTDHPELRAAIAAALRADIVVVAAVGNQHDRGDPTPYPAAYAGVVGVGAVDHDGSRVESSQVGEYVDVMAPGDGVLAANPGRGHVVVSGTSFATPFVSATVALIRSRWPGLGQAEVVRRLLQTADPAAGSRAEYGVGVINPLRALTEVVASDGSGGSSPPGPSASPLAWSTPAADQTATEYRQTRSVAIAAAGALLLAAVAIAAGALAVPAGRRRRWRPGTRTGTDHE
ncbi:MAG TPA: S8 family serine peptidase, partial [Micromonosporaceae bacterium]